LASAIHDAYIVSRAVIHFQERTMAAEVFAAITSLRSALEVAKAMMGLRDAEAFRAKAIELQGIILEPLEKGIEAREAHAAQIDRVRTLEAEVAHLKAWDAEKRRYELKDVGFSGIAYMLKPEARGTEPPYWLCPNCYAQGKKSFFQMTPAAFAGRRISACPVCKSTLAGHPQWID
jgi:rubrerythrin